MSLENDQNTIITFSTVSFARLINFRLYYVFRLADDMWIVAIHIPSPLTLVDENEHDKIQ